MLAEYGLLDLMGGSMPDPVLLGAVLDVFNGHPVPALKRPRWGPAPATSRRTAFAAHLLGLTYAGSYPFLGVPAGVCGCPSGGHLCDGLGSRYLCIDLDDHDGEGGMDRLVSGTAWACRNMGFTPLTFTSRSGTGAHLYVLFDEPVPTREVHALGRYLAREGGAEGRADILPSAGHPTGFGTMHALPLNPQAEANGGGLMLDDRQRPVIERNRVIDRLREAHYRRGTFRPSPSKTPADGSADRKNLSPYLTVPSPPHRGQSGRPLTQHEIDADPTIIEAGAEIVRQMRRLHPQFKRALEVPPGRWKGGRSARDAHLAAMMTRQGVRPLAVAQALLRLPGTKAAERGLGYAVAVAHHAAVEALQPRRAPEVSLAGTKRKARRGATPWRDRHPPPLDYGDERNPWWEPHVQARLTGRTKVRDGVVLAYLIDRWYRGEFPRRQFFLGRRALGDALEMPPSTAEACARRLATKFPDVLRVTPGVPHRKLRLANAFDVVGARSHDRVVWRLDAGQSGREGLCLGQVEREEAMKDVPTGDCGYRAHARVARGYPGARPSDDPSRSGAAAQA